MAAGLSSRKKLGLVVALLLLGTHNTINIKLQYQTCAGTPDPAAYTEEGHKRCPVGQMIYKKPWLNNLYTFIGEASLLVVYAISRRQSRRIVNDECNNNVVNIDQGLLVVSAPTPKLYVFAVPAICDVFGTGFSAVGMQYMDSAIWLMLRSSIIIFSAILTVFFLKRRLQPFHWVATAIVSAGISIVAYASLLDGSATTVVTSGEQLFGIVLVVVSQCAYAFQMVFEEKLVTHTNTFSEKVLGMEGLWGIFFTVIILTLMSTLPGSDNGHFESTPVGLYQATHNPFLLSLIVLYMTSLAMYALTALTIIKYMSSVVRSLVDACRTVVVWLANLFIYYFISKEFGSAWMAHSWMTVIGFLILVYGSLLYNEVVPVPAALRLPPQDEDSGRRCN